MVQLREITSGDSDVGETPAAILNDDRNSSNSQMDSSTKKTPPKRQFVKDFVTPQRRQGKKVKKRVQTPFVHGNGGGKRKRALSTSEEEEEVPQLTPAVVHKPRIVVDNLSSEEYNTSEDEAMETDNNVVDNLFDHYDSEPSEGDTLGSEDDDDDDDVEEGESDNSFIDDDEVVGDESHDFLKDSIDSTFSAPPKKTKKVVKKKTKKVVKKKKQKAKKSEENAFEHADELYHFDLGGKSLELDTFALMKFSNDTNDSAENGLSALKWLIAPMDVKEFLDNAFQNKPLVVNRGNKDLREEHYYSNIFNLLDFTAMIQENHLEYGVNINIAKYTNGIRTTLNDKGRVTAPQLSKKLAEKCSIQCVNPQAFNNNIWYLCDILQDLFGCFVGANTYLTPPNSSGFAPHWDDVDTFLIQTEGRKYWKIYAPLSDFDKLPMESSANLTPEYVRQLQIVFEGYLYAGDLLYMPRGYIHQGTNDENCLSHHVTLSVGRKFTYSEMMKRTLEEVVDFVATDSLQLRTSLSPYILDTTKTKNLGKVSGVIQDALKELISAIPELSYGFIDNMAIYFFKTALPPFLTDYEREHSCFGISDINECPKLKYNSQTHIRLIRRHTQRLLFDENEKLYVIHRMNNSRVYEERPEGTFDIPMEFEGAFNKLVENYPEWTCTKKLNMSKKCSLEFVDLLYSNGILLIDTFTKKSST